MRQLTVFELKAMMVLALLVATGCGSGGTIARVEGIVTLDGQPLPDVNVLFQPKSVTSEGSGGMSSYGVTDKDGKFTLKMSDTQKLGALVGPHTVILSDKLASDIDDSDAGFSNAAKSRIPAELSRNPPIFNVEAGKTNVSNFELQSNTSRAR